MDISGWGGVILVSSEKTRKEREKKEEKRKVKERKINQMKERGL